MFERKGVIARFGRCFRCLAAGHQSKTCPNPRRCGVNGCRSDNHSRYLHSSLMQPSKPTSGSSSGEVERSHSTHQAAHVSLMVLLAYIVNENVKLKVNVLFDPCSTGCYITENAAEELRLQGHAQILTISGTGGSETVKHIKTS